MHQFHTAMKDLTLFSQLAFYKIPSFNLSDLMKRTLEKLMLEILFNANCKKCHKNKPKLPALNPKK